jgi:Ca2+-binding RTX toxin-like protein
MANVSVVPSYSLNPDDFFKGIEFGTLLESTPDLVEVRLPSEPGLPPGNRIQFVGTDLAFDFLASTPWSSGTVSAVRLVDASGSLLAEITGLSVVATDLNATLTADPDDFNYSLHVLRFLLSGDDTCVGGDAGGDIGPSDRIYAGLGDDSIHAGGGNDIIMAGPGGDTIDGGDGLDSIEFYDDDPSYPRPVDGIFIDLGGGTGRNSYGEEFYISNVEVVVGGELNDTIVGSQDDNTLIGQFGNDSIIGGGGDDYLNGGEGYDTLLGGEGNDTLMINGWGGNDVLIGGAGTDQAYMGPLSTFDFHFNSEGKLVFTHKESGYNSVLDGVEKVYAGSVLYSVEDFRPVSISNQTVAEDGVWSFKLPEGAYSEGTTFTVTDLEGRQLPQWISFDVATRTFKGTPPADYNGTIGIKVSTVFKDLPKVSTFTLTVTPVEDTPVNDAPTSLSLTSGWVWENTEKGKPVGTLHAKDANGDRLYYSLVDDAGGRFKIEDNKLVVGEGANLDYEVAKFHNVTVKVTDGQGAFTTQTFTIQVRDVEKENTRGSKGDDSVKGGSKDDKIGGGLGKDVLTGGKGKDSFVFNTKASKTNVDKVTDFNVKDDQVNLDNAVFTKLGKKGTESKPVKMSKDFFTIGTKAKDKNDYVVYDNKKGVLYYDADGSGKGKAVEVATFSNKAKLTADDFFVI